MIKKGGDKSKNKAFASETLPRTLSGWIPARLLTRDLAVREARGTGRGPRARYCLPTLLWSCQKRSVRWAVSADNLL